MGAAKCGPPDPAGDLTASAEKLEVDGAVGAATAHASIVAGQTFQATVGLPGAGPAFRISADALAGRSSCTGGAEECPEAPARLALAVIDASIALATMTDLAGLLCAVARAVIVAEARLHFFAVAALERATLPSVPHTSEAHRIAGARITTPLLASLIALSLAAHATCAGT